MPDQEKESYEFDRFRLDVSERSLVRSDTNERVQLPDKAFETLCVLVRNAGHLVNKNELFTQVWADSFVEENNLNKCIHTVRRALGENDYEQQFIETVKKHGFRFVVEVRSVNSEERGESYNPTLATPSESAALKTEPQVSLSKSKFRLWIAALGLALFLASAIGLGFYFSRVKPTAIGLKQSVAVLPVKPINTVNRDDRYEVGIADSLILKLSSMGIRVRPLSATRKYADIAQDPITAGKEQQADYVLASNYQLADGKIKITAQLFNVASGDIETYKSEKDASDIFAMQDAIAADLGNQLRTRFAVVSSNPAKRGTSNEEAYGFYQQGKTLTFKRTPEGTRQAVESFEQAIRRDPNFAPAYSGMAHALIASGNLGGGLPRVQFDKAREVIQKALALDSSLAEAHAVLGELKFVYDWDFAGAEKDLLRAIELDPNCDLAHEQYASYLIARGRFEEGITEIRTALEIDPNSLMYQLNKGRMLYQARRYDEAVLQLKRIIEVNEDYAIAYSWLWLIYEVKGDDAQAYEWFMKSQKRTKSERAVVFQKAYETSGWPGVRQEVFRMNQANDQMPSANLYAMARQCALMGDKEQAFAYLNKAIAKRQGQMIMLNVDPPFDTLRNDPRFDQLVRVVGLK